MDAPVLPRIVGNSTEQSTPLLSRKMKTRETREYFKGLVWKHLLQGRNPPKPFIPTGLLKCKNPTCPNKWCNQKLGIFTGLNLVFPSELTSFWKFICARTNVLPFFQLHVSSYLCVAPEDKNMDFTGARKRDIQKESMAGRWICSYKASFSNLPLCSCPWVNQNQQSILLLSTVLLDICVWIKADETIIYKLPSNI